MYGVWLSLLLGCPGTPTPPPGDRCQSCHVSTEFIHPDTTIARSVLEGECVICHGGDAEADTLEEAHIAPPANYFEIRGDQDAPFGFLKDFTPDQIAQVPTDYVQFINPGDATVVDRTCGTCHPSQAETFKTSIMTTNAGHYMPSLFLAGFQDREAYFGSYPATDPECDPATFPGTSCDVETLPPPDDVSFDAAIASGDESAIEEMAYQHYVSKQCNHCHAAGYGKQNSPHLFRSSGCTSCHMIYDTNGTYLGADETVPRGVAGYSAEHVITAAIPTEQCATCHFQGGRIGLNFRGIRDASGLRDETCDPDNPTPGCDVVWNETAYGHAAPYYVLDEDGSNDIDETPPDVHFAAGMDCADCHVGSDVHGDGRLYATSKLQVDLSCEDCHGTVDQRREPDAAGQFRTRSGRVLTQLSVGEDGAVQLTSRVEQAVHPVTQIADLGTVEAHRDGNGFAHTESLTCDTCHSSWTLNCLGCHVSVDRRFDQKDFQTGQTSKGLVRGGRQYFSLDTVLLGTGIDGRVQTVNASQQVQMTVIDEDRTILLGQERVDENGDGTGRFDGKFRNPPGFEHNNGFQPFFQHTTSRGADGRACENCHRTEDTPQETNRVRGVYGFGTGEFMLANPNGPDVDALRFLDDEGNATTTWVHRGSGPVSPERRQRALSVLVEE